VFVLIHPFDAHVAASQKDNQLAFHHVQAQPRKWSEFISVRSIIRGVVLVQDFDRAGDYLVLDTVDSDIFLRMRVSKFLSLA